MRHYVVALDENGGTLHNVYYQDGRCWTEDHSEAMKFCGALQEAWTPGAVIAGKKVGGFEVVSEDGPAPLNDSPMFTVLNPEDFNPDVDAIEPTEDTWEGAAFNEDGTWERDWDIFGICGAGGENLVDERVLELARQKGLYIVEDPTGCPFAIEDIADTETERTWEDFLPEALALGLRLAKLPDEVGCPYYRWYVVMP